MVYPHSVKNAPAALLALAMLALAPFAPGQGTFTFGNRPSVIGGTGAPVGFLGDPRPGSPLGGPGLLWGNAFLAQPVVSGVPIEPIVPFGTGAAAGFIESQIIVLQELPPGTPVQVQMAAWFADVGPTYSAALAFGFGHAVSSPVTVHLSHPIDPNQAPMIGLQPFSIPTLPEPSLSTFMVAGLAVLLGCRNRRPAGRLSPPAARGSSEGRVPPGRA